MNAMKSHLWILLISLLVIPLLAIAQTFITSAEANRKRPPKESETPVATAPTVSPGQVICYDLDDPNDSHSPLFHTFGDNGHLSVERNANASSGGTGELYLYECLEEPNDPNNQLNSCGLVPLDVDGDGTLDDPYLNGDDGHSSGEQRRSIYGLPASQYQLRVKTAVGADEQMRACMWVPLR